MKEQIEEIVRDICPFYKEYGSCEKCYAEMDIDDEPCYWACVAKVINQNGYSKQSDGCNSCNHGKDKCGSHRCGSKPCGSKMKGGAE